MQKYPRALLPNWNMAPTYPFAFRWSVANPKAESARVGNVKNNDASLIEPINATGY